MFLVHQNSMKEKHITTTSTQLHIPEALRINGFYAFKEMGEKIKRSFEAKCKKNFS